MKVLWQRQVSACRNCSMEACLGNATDAAMDRTGARIYLVGFKERCRGICVALHNRFLDQPGDCGWYNVSFMP